MAPQKIKNLFKNSIQKLENLTNDIKKYDQYSA